MEQTDLPTHFEADEFGALFEEDESGAIESGAVFAALFETDTSGGFETDTSGGDFATYFEQERHYSSSTPK